MILESLAREIMTMVDKLETRLTVEEATYFKDVLEDLKDSITICNSSAKLLSFNVDDIIVLPQIKDGKFAKNIKNVNIKTAVEEIMSIQ
jgi:hypothetical protein